jgi:hypothetical protein
MRFLLAMTTTALLLSVSAPALGQTQKVWATSKGARPVIIWTSETSAKAGATLINSGQADLAAKYAACVVGSGTAIVIMPTGGYETHRVTVIEGPKRGCEGNLSSSNISRTASGPTLADEHQVQMNRMQAETDAIRACTQEMSAANEAAMKERRAIDLLKFSDECVAKRGFPRKRYDAAGKEIK